MVCVDTAWPISPHTLQETAHPVLEGGICQNRPDSSDASDLCRHWADLIFKCEEVSSVRVRKKKWKEK